MYTNVSTAKDHILYLGRDSNGNRIAERINFQPTVYIPSDLPSRYKTVRGRFVIPFVPGSISECRDFVREKQNSKQEIYGNVNYIAQYIGERHPGKMQYDMSKISIVSIDIETESERGWSLAANATERINVITMKKGDKIYTLCLGKTKIDKPNVEIYEFDDEEDLLVSFIELWRHLEPDIVTGWNNIGFDIPYLVNRIIKVLGMDSARRLSPWKKIRECEIDWQGRKSVGYQIYGVSILDYMHVYRTYCGGNRENWKLDYISKYEFGDSMGKVDWQKIYPSMKEFYHKDFNLFVEYNIQDVELVDMLEKKLRLIQMVVGIAYYSKINYEDVVNQTRIWDSLIYHHLNEQKIIVPMKEKTNTKFEKYKGAAVKDAMVNLHEWVVSVDATSLYPMSIVQWNISPDTIVDYKDMPKEVRERLAGVNVDVLLSGNYDTSWLKKYNLTLTPNGQVFDLSHQGFMGYLILDLFARRKEAKGLMLDAQQKIETLEKQLSNNHPDSDRIKTEIIALKDIATRNSVIEKAAKVTLNSCYGATGNQYFRFYDLRTAEAVTYCGQFVIKSINKAINERLNRLLTDMVGSYQDYDFVVASDTDSAYIRLNRLIRELLPTNSGLEDTLEVATEICDTIVSPHLVEASANIAKYTNAYKQSITFKRESICDRMIVIAKKKYILNVLVGEQGRLSKAKIKLVGVEAIKSSTPGVVRTALKSAIQIMIQGKNSELIEFIDKFRNEFYLMPAEKVAFPRGVSKINKWTGEDGKPIKSTPIHVRGAICYNAQLKKSKVENLYDRIIEGDKIKFIYLTKPNTVWSNVISFPRTIPSEFDLNNNIDYNLQFEKTFIDPLTAILKVINWTTTKTSTFADCGF